MTRLIGITYAGVTVGKDQSETSYELSEVHSFRHSHESVDVEFNVIVSNSTRATFLSAEAALLTAFRTPNQSLVIVLGSATRHTYVPGSNTGFLSRATIQLQDAHANTAVYRCAVSLQLPADLQSRAGRREGSVVVEITPAQLKKVRIAGIYTALTSSSATAQYASVVGAWVTTMLGAFSETFELTDENYDYDDENKLLKFQRVYEEVYGNQGFNTLDVSGIVKPLLSISRRVLGTESPEGVNVEIPVELTARYSCWVRKNVTTNLRAYYISTIRPAILEHVQTVAGGPLVLETDEPEFYPHENRVTSSLRLLSISSSILALRVTTKESLLYGTRVYPVHFDGGDPFEAAVYRGPAVHVLQVYRTAVVTDGVELGDLGLPRVAAGFVPITREQESYRHEKGVAGARTALRAVTDIYTYRRVAKPPPPPPAILLGIQ